VISLAGMPNRARRNTRTYTGVRNSSSLSSRLSGLFKILILAAAPPLFAMPAQTAMEQINTASALESQAFDAFENQTSNTPESRKSEQSNQPISGELDLDQQSVHIVRDLITGNIEAASRNARNLVERYPEFALAQLLYGELQALAAMDSLQVSAQYDWSPRLVKLLSEARRRLNQAEPLESKPSKGSERVPASIVQAGINTKQILLVDVDNSTLFRYQNQDGSLRLLNKHYVSSGRAGAGKTLEGDLKTPVGLYRITDSLIDAELPALYGHGALVLDYPNSLDRRMGKTGHGIWLHGNPSGQISRAPYSSEGCVTMTNEHIANLMTDLPQIDTQVVLTQTVNWLSPMEASRARDEWIDRFNTWRQAWLGNDPDALTQFYHPLTLPQSVKNAMQDSAFEKVSQDRSATSSLQDDELLRKRLSKLDQKSISIFSNPLATGAKVEARHVKMVLPATIDASAPETILWWAQHDDGQWQILMEEHAQKAF